MEHNLTKQAEDVEVVSKETGLTSQQEKGAILLASGLRLSDVAKELGTSRGTLYRWMNQVTFQCFYNLMKQDAKNYLEGCVLGLHSQALEGLQASLSSCNESIRLKASMWVIEQIGKIGAGETDARKVLKEQSVTEEDWLSEGRYQNALKEAGMDF